MRGLTPSRSHYLSAFGWLVGAVRGTQRLPVWAASREGVPELGVGVRPVARSGVGPVCGMVGRCSGRLLAGGTGSTLFATGLGLFDVSHRLGPLIREAVAGPGSQLGRHLFGIVLRMPLPSDRGVALGTRPRFYDRCLRPGTPALFQPAAMRMVASDGAYNLFGCICQAGR